ncbi:MAG: FGGY-family carbohydrate kinase [Planctomycetaceae bacterium]
MGLELPHAILTEEALAQNVTNEGGVDGTYRLLKNIMGLWLIQECKRSFERQGKSFDYGTLMNLARDAKPFRSLLNPDDNRFLKPDDMATEIRNYCRETNQPVPESEGELIRCAMESLSFKYRMVLEGLQKLSGEEIEVIHIVGGGCQNTLLNQMTANACGVPVIAGPVEATVLGNILLQARALGELETLHELREVVRNSDSLLEFNPDDQAKWNENYHRFLELLIVTESGKTTSCNLIKAAALELDSNWWALQRRSNLPGFHDYSRARPGLRRRDDLHGTPAGGVCRPQLRTTADTQPGRLCLELSLTGA